MRIVAHDALRLGIMFFRIYAGYFRTGAILIGEIGMAADTESSTAIYFQPYWVSRVIKIGAMAVFTAYGTMRRVLDIVIFILVTFCTDRCRLVFDREFLPLGLVGFAMPAIHVATFFGAEVIRN